MIYTSLLAVAMSASAVVTPLSNFIHLHPHAAQPDTRISVTLYNNANLFRDVKVDGHIYTVTPQHSITIKAPAGTVVYADSRMYQHRRGDVLMEVTPQANHTRFDLN